MQSDKQKLSRFLQSKKASQFCLPLMLVVMCKNTTLGENVEKI
jgi:hypothetical protein